MLTVRIKFDSGAKETIEKISSALLQKKTFKIPGDHVMKIVNCVCKRIYLILVITKQLYIPSNPLLASFSSYISETQYHQGFYAIKGLDCVLIETGVFAKILAR